jgi:putative ABC transport system permease protein
MVGTAMAYGLSKMTEILIRNLLPYAPTGSLIQLDASLVVTTLVAVVFIGFVSGIYPAWKAARIRPLESIRSEVS